MARLSAKVPVFVGAWLAVGGVGVLAAHHYGDALVVNEPRLDLVQLEDTRVGDEAGLQRWLDTRGKQLQDTLVELRSADGTRAIASSTLGELGVRLDVDETRGRVQRSAMRQRVRVPFWPHEELSSQVHAAVQVDMTKLLARADALKDRVDVAPRSARLDLDARAVIPERMGESLDAFALASSLQNTASVVLEQHGGQAVVVRVPVVATPPKMTGAMASAIDIGVVLSEFETHFSRGGEQARRGQNIDNAAAKLDGAVLMPDQVVSFNELVGERSEANGFAKSWEIFKGEMVEGVGGGTCQVSSTLHAASFFGGLEVLERLPHSRPSAYISMGLDSTVVYPTVDLKLKNPFPFPVVVHTITRGNTLKVELLGRERPVEVKFTRELVKRIPFTRKLVEEPSLAANRVVHKQHGIDGYRIKRIREMRFANGPSKVEETTDYYPPTFDIYEVPLGFDPARLPGLRGDGDVEEARVAASSDDPASATRVASGSSAHAAEGAASSAPGDELVIVDAKGAHAPSRQQTRPEARLRMDRRDP